MPPPSGVIVVEHYDHTDRLSRIFRQNKKIVYVDCGDSGDSPIDGIMGKEGPPGLLQVAGKTEPAAVVAHRQVCRSRGLEIMAGSAGDSAVDEDGTLLADLGGGPEFAFLAGGRIALGRQVRVLARFSRLLAVDPRCRCPVVAGQALPVAT